MNRYFLMLVLLLLAVGIPSYHARSATSASADHGWRSPATLAGVPEGVRTAAEQGRYWRASRLMGDYLATVSDTTPATILLTAGLHAGWDDWPTVAALLEGRDWLGREGGGAGWELLGRSLLARGQPQEAAEALARYLEQDPPPADRARAMLRLGLAHAEAGEAERAVAAFDGAAALLPWFADWSALFAAEAGAAAGDTAVARRYLARAGEVADGRGWRLRLRAAREAGDSLRAREVALEAASGPGPAAGGAAAWVELAALRLAAGDTARAREAFLQALDAPATVAAVDAARALSALEPTPAEWRRIARVYARHGNAARAADGYERYLAAGVGSGSERQAVRLRLGRALFNAGRYAQAERRLLALAEEDVTPSLGAEALYLAGRAQYRRGRSAEGQRTLARLPDRFPGEETVAQGLYLLADLKHDDQELEAARRYYRQAAAAAPHVNEAGLALMRLGGLDMLAENYEDAAATFDGYRALHPDGRRWAQATYWAARAHAALGRDDRTLARLRELRDRDPLSYYGVRAAELLDVPVLDVPMAEAPGADSVFQDTLADGLRRVDLLADLGRRDELVREVERLRRRLEGREPAEYALAEALTARGYTLTGIGMGWELFRRSQEWNPRLLRIIYPFPFRTLVVPEARERGLDPYLVAAVIRRESAFNPTVTSGAGAIGLMQVMPETGRALARETRLSSFRPDLLRQPEVNVHLGTRYLATMLDRFDHELPLVLSAYNAGPTRAVRWRELPEAVDLELFTERIPYAETRDYVRNVLLHRALYQALYPDLDEAAVGTGG